MSRDGQDREQALRVIFEPGCGLEDTDRSRLRGSKYDALVVCNEERNVEICELVGQIVRQELEIEGIEFGFPGIVFVRKKAHARILAEILSDILDTEIPHVTSDTPKAERDGFVARMKLRDPELPAVVACQVWSTGIDIPPLEWVVWAGEGQAPAGLKQSGGRATRLEGDKSGYVILDIQSTGPGTEAYQEQGRKRLQHYRDGGFNIADTLHPNGANSADSAEPDVVKTQQLFEIISGAKSAAPPNACDIDMPPSRVDDSSVKRAEQELSLADHVFAVVFLVMIVGSFVAAYVLSTPR